MNGTILGPKELKTRFFLDPFYIFATIWAAILLIHSLNLNTVYPPLTWQLWLFFLVVIMTSFIFGYLYDRFYLRHFSLVLLRKDKPSYFLMVGCVLAFLLAVYANDRTLPLMGVLHGNPYAYNHFGIPTFTPMAVSFTLALNAVSSVKLMYGREHRLGNLIGVLVAFMIFFLSYSRGCLIVAGLTFAFVFFSRYRFSWVSILAIIILGILAMLAFNAFGNLRQQYAWNDSTYIMHLSGFRYPNSILRHFSWSLVYIDTPLGNLAYNYKNVPPTYDIKGLLSQLLPDALGKRLFPGYDSALELAQPALTVSSFWAGGYKFYGLLGMAVQYIEGVLVIFLLGKLTRDNTKLFLSVSAGMTMLCALTFFDNTFTYSGFAFFVVLLVLSRIYKGKDNLSYDLNQTINAVILCVAEEL